MIGLCDLFSPPHTPRLSFPHRCHSPCFPHSPAVFRLLVVAVVVLSFLMVVVFCVCYHYDLNLLRRGRRRNSPKNGTFSILRGQNRPQNPTGQKSRQLLGKWTFGPKCSTGGGHNYWHFPRPRSPHLNQKIKGKVADILIGKFVYFWPRSRPFFGGSFRFNKGNGECQ